MKLKALFTAGLIWSAALVSTGQPRVEWLSDDYDFGAFDESLETVTCVFRGINTGTEPLQVVDARSTCGCTTPRYSTDPVAPGDTLVVTVGYKATGRPGRFSKKVIIRTNGEPSRNELTIRGTVIGTGNTLRSRYPVEVGPHMRLRTADFLFGSLRKNDVKGVYIEGYNASDRPMRPSLSGLPKYVSVVAEPAEVPPGDTFVLSATFDAAMCPLWDVVNDLFTFDAGDRNTVELGSTAIVEEDFSNLTPEQRRDAPSVTLSQEVLDAGRVNITGTKPLKFNVKIGNSGRSPLKIRRIYTADEAIKLTLKGGTTVKPGKQVNLEVTVNPRAIADYDMLNDRIIVITDDPGASRKIIRLVGEIIGR